MNRNELKDELIKAAKKAVSVATIVGATAGSAYAVDTPPGGKLQPDPCVSCDKSRGEGNFDTGGVGTPVTESKERTKPDGDCPDEKVKRDPCACVTPDGKKLPNPVHSKACLDKLGLTVEQARKLLKPGEEICNAALARLAKRIKDPCQCVCATGDVIENPIKTEKCLKTYSDERKKMDSCRKVCRELHQSKMKGKNGHLRRGQNRNGASHGR